MLFLQKDVKDFSSVLFNKEPETSSSKRYPGLGVDFGTQKIGLAISDGQMLVSSPFKVIKLKSSAQKDVESAFHVIINCIKEFNIKFIVFGLHLTQNGSISDFGKTSIMAARLLDSMLTDTANLNCPILLWDERYSTIGGIRDAIQLGSTRKNLNDKDDAFAASFILQGAIDAIKELL